MHHKRALLVVSLVLTAFSTVGCQSRTLRRYSLVLPETPSLVKKAAYTSDAYTKDKSLYDQNTDPSKPDRDATVAKQARNSIAWGLMGAIDQVYGEYTARLFTGQGTVLLVGDTATLGLTAAASIASKTTAKTIFAALGTALTGVNLSVSKNFFAQQTFQALGVAMEAGRGRIRQQISEGLAKDVTDYPLSAVQRDLVAYLYAGSLPGGLQEIQMEAGGTARQTQGTAAGGTGSVLKIAPSSLPFGSQTRGGMSAAQTITLTNTGSVALTGINVTITGTNAAEFNQSNTCGSSLAAGANCTISVTFSPATGSAQGPHGATLAVTCNNAAAPVPPVNLTGTAN